MCWLHALGCLDPAEWGLWYLGGMSNFLETEQMLKDAVKMPSLDGYD